MLRGSKALSASVAAGERGILKLSCRRAGNQLTRDNKFTATKGSGYEKAHDTIYRTQAGPSWLARFFARDGRAKSTNTR
jgi:hypothetical protein